ncbi:hypothetical protein QOT17_001808 [Balamuthia mandrillaris]
MKSSRPVGYDHLWRWGLSDHARKSAVLSRIVPHMAARDWVEAYSKIESGKIHCEQYRKKGLIPGVIRAGLGQPDIPLLLPLRELVSYRSRGGFMWREYNLLLDEKEVIKVKPHQLVTHPTTDYPRHIVFDRLSQFTEPPPLSEEDQKAKEEFEYLISRRRVSRRPWNLKRKHFGHAQKTMMREEHERATKEDSGPLWWQEEMKRRREEEGKRVVPPKSISEHLDEKLSKETTSASAAPYRFNVKASPQQQDGSAEKKKKGITGGLSSSLSSPKQ